MVNFYNGFIAAGEADVHTVVGGSFAAKQIAFLRRVTLQITSTT